MLRIKCFNSAIKANELTAIPTKKVETLDRKIDSIGRHEVHLTHTKCSEIYLHPVPPPFIMLVGNGIVIVIVPHY